VSTWPPAGLRQRRLDLEDTAAALAACPDTPEQLESCTARYLVVRSAGYLEAVRDDVADQYVALKASDEVARRVRSGLRTGQGVAPGQLLDFVKSFHPSWHAELESFLGEDDGRLKTELGALVAARKKVAHGSGENVTAGRALRWAEAAERLGAWLVRRFDPASRAADPIVPPP
jgi:hypothetical protein